MSGTFLTLLRRDCAQLLLGGRRGGALLPVLFFLAVAMLYPFAVGPDAPLLAKTGGGVIWVAALLAAILPIDRLIEPDLELGLFDQFAMRGISEEGVVSVRMLPCSAGTVKMLPRASTTARAADGEIEKPEIFSPRFLNSARAVRSSA